MRLMASWRLLGAALLGDTPVAEVLRNVEPCEVGSYAPLGCDPFSCCDDLTRPVQPGVCGTFAAEGVRWWVSATVVIAGLDLSGRVDWLYASRPELAVPHASCPHLGPKPLVERILEGDVVPGPRDDGRSYHLITP